jgi:hypothetical protein
MHNELNNQLILLIRTILMLVWAIKKFFKDGGIPSLALGELAAVERFPVPSGTPSLKLRNPNVGLNLVLTTEED